MLLVAFSCSSALGSLGSLPRHDLIIHPAAKRYPLIIIFIIFFALEYPPNTPITIIHIIQDNLPSLFLHLFIFSHLPVTPSPPYCEFIHHLSLRLFIRVPSVIVGRVLDPFRLVLPPNVYPSADSLPLYQSYPLIPPPFKPPYRPQSLSGILRCTLLCSL